MFQQLLLYFNTIRYLKPVQVYGRIYAFIKKGLHIYRIPAPPAELAPELNSKTEWLYHEPWNNREAIIKNKFNFLNQKIDMGNRITWEPKASLIWKFNLHYFHYLYRLERNEQREICLDWINNNPAGKGTGWHPYTLSLRIVNWIKTDLQIDEINKSLFKQAAYLYRHTEFYHPGNHYLENAKALIFAGIYFKFNGEAKKWFNKGLKIFRKNLLEQLNKDGGYFEPSVSYHAIILYGILDVINIIDEQNAQLFVDAADEMIVFLDSLTQPDGEITLFNDSALNYAPKTTDLIYYAEDLNLVVTNIKPAVDRISLTDFNDSGFAVVRSDKLYFAIDYGGIRPANIPVHCHPGVFNYVLSVEDTRFIVDSGTGSYEPGDIRNFVRKSLAHNTLTIDNLEQAEAWGVFRIGRRFMPSDVKIIERNGEIIFNGKFTGYEKLIGDNLIFIRTIKISKDSVEFTDEVSGSGGHKVKSFIHLHPDVQAVKQDKNILLNSEATEVKLNVIEGSSEIRESNYYPDFGVNIKNKVITILLNNIPGKIIYRFEY
jgi:uncharacterized heparinase superfamily protein